MAQGSKKKYTSKQKRKAHDIEKGYKKRGVSSKEAERRAWATVNKSDKGGRKKRRRRSREKAEQIEFSHGWQKRRPEITPAEFRSANPSGLVRIGRTPTFTLTWPVSFVQPWLLFCRELCASFSTNAQSFSFALQLWLPS